MRTSYRKGDGAEPPSLTVPGEDNGSHFDGAPGPDEIAQLKRGYERPRLLVIGDIRSLTAGSTSSGNKDANSQYYW